MEVSIKSQLLATAYAIFFGLFLGIIYDFSRSIRVLITGSFDLKFKNNVVLKKLPLFKVICKNREEKAVKPYKIITFFTDVLFHGYLSRRKMGILVQNAVGFQQFDAPVGDLQRLCRLGTLLTDLFAVFHQSAAPGNGQQVGLLL